jgi:hypothetical protein
MAGHGPPPKPDAERARRNAPPAPEVAVTPDDVLRGPDLAACGTPRATRCRGRR